MNWRLDIDERIFRDSWRGADERVKDNIFRQLNLNGLVSKSIFFS